MSDPFQNMLPSIHIPQCLIHNEPCLFAYANVQTQQPLMCIYCIPNMKKSEDQIQENQQIFLDFQYKNKRKIDILSQFLNNITQSINKLIKLINVQIEQIKINQTNLNQLASKSKLIEINPIIQMNQVQNQSFQQFIKQITQKFKDINQYFNIDLLISGLQQSELIQNDEDDKQQYQYSQVINSIEQNDDCVAIAIDPNNQFVAASINNSIKIFKFEREKLKQIQQLDYHSNQVKCLTFMKKSQQLISGCFGGQIVIWELNSQQQWQPCLTLNGNQDGLYSLVINQNEDLIISGSKIVKFWKLGQRIWKCVIRLYLSLNESNTKLIISIWNQKQIKVFEKIRNQWCEIQTLKIASFRLCFVDDNLFAVQVVRDQLQFFHFDKKNKQFIQGQNIQVQNSKSDWNYFPMQYIKQKGILIDKNCQYINILRRKQNEFILEQTIDFENNFLFGCASDDGQYLFTWDQKSNLIQVRRLEVN